MMKCSLLLVTLVFLMFCHYDKQNKPGSHINSNIDTSVGERFSRYLTNSQLKPVVTLENINDQNQIELSNHKITWFDTDEETKVKIDNDLFTLKRKRTINVVWGDSLGDMVDFANYWDEIKL